ncbi:hypothetical protein K440DRAFT_635736 [Wilcoxina mikolae CBS 423.85]|nr:hypothetical protein K440DRAFT_635736 [Wilcoxina mikolae CBS 423.85]
MTFTLVNESSSTATAIKESALHCPMTVEKAGCRTLVDLALATTRRYRKVISPTMIAPDITISTESPPAESPPAKLSSAESPPIKLSSAESSPTKPFPTLDLISVTSKTMDHVPQTLPFQGLESLCDGFFPDRYFVSIQEAVEITVNKLSPQDQWKFMYSIYELFADIHEVSNSQVEWLSEFEANNAGWRELGYKRYYDYLRTIDSSGQVREMVKQHNTVQRNQDHAMKTLRDYWQQSPELLEILNEGDGNGTHPLTSKKQRLYWKKDVQYLTKRSTWAPTPSESLSLEDSYPEILDIPDTTPDGIPEAVDDVIEVVDDVTEVVDEDDEDT